MKKILTILTTPFIWFYTIPTLLLVVGFSLLFTSCEDKGLTRQTEFDELRCEDGKVTDEQWTIYDQWDSDNYNAREFGSAWVQPVELDLQSWRERKLESLL
jgi:hypothetical protein